MASSRGGAGGGGEFIALAGPICGFSARGPRTSYSGMQKAEEETLLEAFEGEGKRARDRDGICLLEGALLRACAFNGPIGLAGGGASQ